MRHYESKFLETKHGENQMDGPSQISGSNGHEDIDCGVF